ncbi:DUF4178 domain-containing protein [Chryseobacterium salviniae]|uniref:DUF4178 domain-containing protein n=1 Tax=Chryseobacterium salviniae TaxID=3101750 RepID=A0ABU6HW76_9FLAO|nr:DUF4178 domain-containing protein [Chryseobacterium sp. T9W2-O]MEC3877093.1 DUF4178 domain-containing protein [Chryseobacterium sp. T9W2-O]
MHYICPVCKTENTIDADFKIGEYVCKSCSNLIDIPKNVSTKVVKKPIENVVLEVGQKGTIDGTEYTVTGIIIRKYGSTIFWREYYLKDKKGGNAFLSESDGHWVLLYSIDKMEIKRKSWNSIILQYGTLNLRRYETTECHIHAAAGFFEDSLDFGLSTYKEYVNGTQMISEEKSKDGVQYFFGKHISRCKVKKAFNIANLPNYTGIGIVQPFYVNVKQAINIMAVSALIICLIQLYVVATRTNASVFEQEIYFADVLDKEMVSKSFELSGGSAPLKVEISSDVNNSWANVGLGLVNEKNNEIVFASKDIEEYHGYEDGESWSEGSKDESFNFCGVAPGKYHFVISAQRQEPVQTSLPTTYRSPDGNLSLSRDAYGTISVTNNLTLETTAFGDAKLIRKDSMSALGKLVHQTLGKTDIDSLLNANAQAETISATPENKSVKIKAEWLPVSFGNFVFVLLFLVALALGLYFGRRAFERSKWFNSSNSPYTYS